MNPARVFLQSGGVQRKPEPVPPTTLAPQEAAALLRLQREAAERGATLRTGGRGGIAPSMVLGVLRRDQYECKIRRKGCTGNQDLTIHHKGGIAASAWLIAKAHSRDLNNLVTSCHTCHDTVHDLARADGTHRR